MLNGKPQYYSLSGSYFFGRYLVPTTIYDPLVPQRVPAGCSFEWLNGLSGPGTRNLEALYHRTFNCRNRYQRVGVWGHRRRHSIIILLYGVPRNRIQGLICRLIGRPTSRKIETKQQTVFHRSLQKLLTMMNCGQSVARLNSRPAIA